MSLTKKEVEQLFKLGFKRPDYADKVYPQAIFEYQDSIWVVGGRIIPNSWIPSLDDLLTWLEDNDFLFELSYIGNGYKIKVIDVDGNEYKSKGSNPVVTYYTVLLKVLEKLGGNIKSKSYIIDEVEIIERKDLS